MKFYMKLRHKLATLKSCLYDKRLGIDASREFRKAPKAAEDNSFYKDMISYQPVFYGRLEKVLAYLKLTEDDVFVDLGCGKGRVLFFMAQQRIKKVIGVELNSDLFTVAQENLRNLRHRNSQIELLNIDAVCFDPVEVTIFFLFNPFGQSTLEKVLSNIKNSLSINPRKIRIVYYSAQFRQVLDKQNWLTYEGFVENDACLVWRSNQNRGKEVRM